MPAASPIATAFCSSISKSRIRASACWRASSYAFARASRSRDAAVATCLMIASCFSLSFMPLLLVQCVEGLADFLHPRHVGPLVEIAQLVLCHLLDDEPNLVDRVHRIAQIHSLQCHPRKDRTADSIPLVGVQGENRLRDLANRATLENLGRHAASFICCPSQAPHWPQAPSGSSR